MKKLFSMLVANLLFVSILLSQSAVSVQASSLQDQQKFGIQDAQNTISQYAYSINKKDWNTYISLQPNQDQNDLHNYLTNNADPSNEGILSIKSASIQEIKNIPINILSNCVDIKKYTASYDNVYGFLVGINYNVKN